MLRKTNGLSRWRGEHPPLAPSNSGTVGLSRWRGEHTLLTV
ncbi:hypothetical protein ACP0HM_15670 [Escherichia coli]